PRGTPTRGDRGEDQAKREDEEPDRTDGLYQPAAEPVRVHQGVLVVAAHVRRVAQAEGEGAEHDAAGGGGHEWRHGEKPSARSPGEDREGRQPRAAAVE